MTTRAGVPSPRRLASLDAWRGIACLSVAVFHSSTALDQAIDGSVRGWVSLAIRQLWIGVPLFFVISGYCIAATSDVCRHTNAPMSRFFKRRVRRIYPPYWTLLAVAVAVNALAFGTGWIDRFSSPPLANPADLAWPQWLGNATLTEGIRFHVGAAPYKVFLGHAWTLMYEEQFYLLCGLLLLVCPRRFFAGTAAITLFTCCIAPWSFKRIGIYTFGLFSDGRWFVFMAGVMVYYAVNRASRRTAMLIAAALAAGAIAGVAFVAWLWRMHVAPAHTINHDQVELGIEFVAGSTFALILLLTHGWDRHVATSPIARPLMACGAMSYSIYLVHLPLTNVTSMALMDAGVNGFWGTLLLTIPAGVAISVAAGWAFYHAVERHFLNRSAGERRAAPVAVPAAANLA